MQRHENRDRLLKITAEKKIINAAWRGRDPPVSEPLKVFEASLEINSLYLKASLCSS